MIDPRLTALARRLALVCPLIVSVVALVLAARRPAAPVEAHRLGGTSASMAQFGVFDVRTFGAKCDGSTNDAAAITAADAAAATAHGQVLIPPAVCLVNSMISASSGAVWRGTPGQSTVKAGASIAAVAAFTGAVDASGITFDANRLAKHAVLRLNDQYSAYTRCQFNNGLVDGVREACSTNNVLGAVNRTGGGPAITVSTPDPYCLGFECPHTFVKVTAGGALGTATVRTSCDGASYSSLDITLFAQTNLPFIVGTSPETMTGLQLSAAAGTYVLNTVYDFTASTSPSINNYPHFESCQANGNGTDYVTSGISASYPSPTYNPVAATGTIAVTTSSPLVTGTGTHFMSYVGATDGDQLLVHVGVSNDKRFMVSAVISDTVLYLDPLSLPSFTGSGLDFLYAAGAGYSQDVETGNQNGAVYNHCIANNDSNGFRLSGLGGASLIAPAVHNYAVSGIILGSACAD